MPTNRQLALLVTVAAASFLFGCSARAPSSAESDEPDATDLAFRQTSSLSPTETLRITDFTPGMFPDGGTDWYPAAQSAVNTACSYGYTNPPVVIPQGTFAISQPIVSPCSNEIIGVSRTGSVLQPVFNGPAIMMEAVDSSLLPLVPAHIGTGSALDEGAASAGGVWLDFREVPGVDLDGLATFTAEALFELQNASAAGALLQGAANVGNGGDVVPGDSTTRSAPNSEIHSFTIQVDGAQHVSGRLTVGGSSIAVNSNALPLLSINTVHHVALTYDGATVRFWVDGQGGSAANQTAASASGPIKQSVFEEVTVGALANRPVGGNPFNVVTGITVDSARISNVDRYGSTAPHPTSKFTPDANNLALANFDGNPPTGTALVWSGTTPYWLPVHTMVEQQPAILRDFTVQGGMGIFGQNAAYGTISQVSCLGCYDGILLPFAVEEHVDDVLVTAGSVRARYGVAIATANGAELHDLSLGNQQLPLVVMNAAQDVLTNVQIAAGSSTVFGALLYVTDSVIDGLNVTGGGPSYRGGAAIVAPWSRTILSRASITMPAGSSAVPIVVDPSGTAAPPIVLQNSTFSNTQSVPEIVHLNSELLNMVDGGAAPASEGTVLMNVTEDSTVPLTDDPNVIVNPITGLQGFPDAGPPSDPGPAAVLGLPVGNQFNSTAFGAVGCTFIGSQSATCPNGPVDSYPGIQDAIDSACANGNGLVTVPTGFLWLSQPLTINCSLELEGTARLIGAQGGSLFRAMGDSWDGPAIVINPPGMTGVDVATWPFGGGGAYKAMNTDIGFYYLNLRDSASAELDGLTGFTAEAIVDLQGDATPNVGYAGIVQSAGCLGTGAPLPGCTSAFKLGTMSGNLYGSMTVGGVNYALSTTTAVPFNVQQHVALTYDGATIRLFLNGNLVSSAAVSGTNLPMNQNISEDVTVGRSSRGFDSAFDVTGATITGLISAVRLSNTALYTCNFANPPVDKFPAGNGARSCDGGATGGASSTLVSLDFANNPPGMTVGAVGSSARPFYFPVRRSEELTLKAEGTVSVTIKDLTSQTSMGIFGVNTAGSHFLNVGGDANDIAILLTGDNTGVFMDEVATAAGGRGRYGVLVHKPVQGYFRNLSVGWAKLPLVASYGGALTFENIFVNPGSPTNLMVYGPLFSHDGAVKVDGLYVDMETTEPSGWLGNLVVEASTAPFYLFGGELDGPGIEGAVPFVTIDRGAGYVFEGTSFGATSAAAPEVIHVTGPVRTGSPHVAVGVQTMPGSNLSDDPSIQVVSSASGS